MENKTTHMPTPWEIDPLQKGRIYKQMTEPYMHGKTICEAGPEDAAFIVRAVNSHQELLELVKTMSCNCISGAKCIRCRTIEKAEEK